MRSSLGIDPKTVLDEIQEIVLKQRKKYDKVYEQILRDLADQNVFILNEKQLDEEHGEFVRSYFQSKVRPLLMPVMLGQTEKFPDLKDDSIYLAISLVKMDPRKLHQTLHQHHQ